MSYTSLRLGLPFRIASLTIIAVATVAFAIARLWWVAGLGVGACIIQAGALVAVLHRNKEYDNGEPPLSNR